MTRWKRGIAVSERRSRNTTAPATAARQATVTASSQPDCRSVLDPVLCTTATGYSP